MLTSYALRGPMFLEVAAGAKAMASDLTGELKKSMNLPATGLSGTNVVDSPCSGHRQRAVSVNCLSLLLVSF